ncbi:pyridoxal phosphate-dependent aminotransferase, partial [Francisella tularensis subsp. holarctica]|nr:pyridoxal phosphate-dependent aminotransferase [Francisella tularensis subsp. holarctica]
YDGLVCTSFGNLNGVEDRVIIVDSVSKRSSAGGARIGSLCSKNKECIMDAPKLCQARGCVPTREPLGAAARCVVSEDYL